MDTKKTNDTISLLEAMLENCRERMKDPNTPKEYLRHLIKSEERIKGSINSLESKLN
ncbi:MAG TPA: hypothetical protein VIH28_08250 [Ignavibacteriaceae bacterium]